MHRFFFLAICLFLFASLAPAQTNTTWQSTDGDWSNGSNWTNGIPDGWYNAYLTTGARTIRQDITNLDLMGLTLDAFGSNLVLDQSVTINGVFNFLNGTVSGDGNLTLAEGAAGIFGSGAQYDGNLLNGGGALRILGSANVADSFNVNGFSELSGSGWVQGPGELILNNAFIWNGGTMTDDGLTTINAGSLVHDGILDRTVNNFGQSVVTGVGLTGTNNGVWNNLGTDSFFKLSGDQNLSGTGIFNNLDEGLFKKTGGSLSNIDWEFIHQGQMLLVESGKMAFRSAATIDGLMTVVDGATIEFQSNTYFGENASHSGDGTMVFNGANAFFNQTYDGYFDTQIKHDAVLFGSANISFHRDFTVVAGNFIGPGELNLYGDSDFSNATIQKTFNNFGFAQLSNGLISGSGTWNNQAGSSITLAGFNNAILGNGQIDNAFGANINATSGNSWIQWNAANSGTISVADSSLSFRGDFLQSATGDLVIDNGVVEFRGDAVIGGTLKGNGTITSTSNRIVVEGIVQPGNGIDTLHFLGDVEFIDETIFEFEIGDLESDQIDVVGDLYLDGQISIGSLGDITIGQYVLFSYSGNLFDSGLNLYSLPGHVDGNLYYDSTSKSIGVNITTIPEPGVAPFAILFAMVFKRRRNRANSTT